MTMIIQTLVMQTMSSITTQSEPAAAVTAMKAVMPQPQLKEFYCSQSSHSLAYKKI